ncbi:MAG: (d)CMP kinase [Rickettsiaceae bacterium]|nr:(d)CMP kinase [Rickettsiaceae bacterium]
MNLTEKANNKNLDFKIALDGPSASGKGLIGSMLAKEFSLKYVQSSIIYRGLAFVCIEDGIDPDNIDAVMHASENEDVISRVKGVDLNTELIGDVASKISTIPGVRANLTKYLINLMNNTPRIVMEGRDIGTVVAPDADVKIFISADVQVRAMRRYKQLQSEGKDCILDDVLDLLKKRDARDSNRNVAPLKAADDALVIDTSELNPSEVILKIKEFIYR